MKSIVLTPKGTCAKSIVVVLDDDGIIDKVTFVGGCKGGLQGIARLVKGMTIQQAAEKLDGIVCRGGTSCPDQMAKLLRSTM